MTIGTNPSSSRSVVDAEHKWITIIDPNLVVPLKGKIVTFNFYLDPNTDHMRSKQSHFDFQVYRPLNNSILYNPETRSYEYDDDQVKWFSMVYRSKIWSENASKFDNDLTKNKTDQITITLNVNNGGQAEVEAGDILGLHFADSNAIPYSEYSSDKYCPKMMMSFLTDTSGTGEHDLNKEKIRHKGDYKMDLNKTNNTCKKYAFQAVLEVDPAIAQFKDRCKYNRYSVS